MKYGDVETLVAEGQHLSVELRQGDASLVVRLRLANQAEAQVAAHHMGCDAGEITPAPAPRRIDLEDVVIAAEGGRDSLLV